MKYFVQLEMTFCAIVDDAQSLEEAKEIVESMYINDEMFDSKYDTHYEWDILNDKSYEFEDEEEVA